MEILELLNPWWKENKVSLALALPYKRKIYGEIQALFQQRPITILSGLRRVGKSTILYQTMAELLANKISGEHLLYFSFDEKKENILDIFEEYARITNVDWKKERCFVFFDEIQKFPDWSNKIKMIYDQFPNLKIMVTGSSSFQLEKEAKANLAGRHFLVSVEPLSFEEYLQLTNSKIELAKQQLWQEEIIKEFENYLQKPFPEIVTMTELRLIKTYIKDNVIEKVVRVDLTEKFKNVNEDLLLKLIELIYGKPGMYLNYDELSKDLGISKKTLLQHMYYLEFAYVIRKIRNFRPSTRSVSRKMQRAYPYHWALGFGWTGKVDAETVVATLLDARYYWREQQKEIDFLVGEKYMLPVEVKEGIRLDHSELRNMSYFLRKFKAAEGVVISRGAEEKIAWGDLTFKKIPLWKVSLYDKKKNSFPG